MKGFIKATAHTDDGICIIVSSDELACQCSLLLEEIWLFCTTYILYRKVEHSADASYASCRG